MIPAKAKDKYLIRFTVTSQNTTEEDIKRDWEIIKNYAYELLEKFPGEIELK
jgi:histidine decarboxylase